MIAKNQFIVRFTYDITKRARRMQMDATASSPFVLRQLSADMGPRAPLDQLRC